MEFRQLGTSSVYLPALTFGAWAIENWGVGSIEKKKAIEAIQKAYDLNYTAIDTAPIYGLGYSEIVVAEALKGLPREKFQILTKFGTSWKPKGKKLINTFDLKYQDLIEFHDFYSNCRKDGIIKQCEDSLRRLKVDYVDLYSLHWSDKIVPIEESMEALVKLLAEGKIKAAGVCNHSLNQMQLADNVINLSANKVRYSMLNRGIEEDIIPFCVENKKSILAYCVLQRGILTGIEKRHFIWGPDEENPKELALYKPSNLARIDSFLNVLKSIALDYGLNLSQLCINWTVAQTAISSVLIAASSVDEVIEMTKSLEVKLNKGDFELINKHLSDLENSMDMKPSRYTYNYEEGIVNFE